jgi:hypothetical protein
MMGANWMPTVAGLIAAIGAGLVAANEPSLHLIGVILSVVGTALLGFVAKQYNVHGGTVAQATPPSVQAKSAIEGVALVAEACKKDPEKCEGNHP